MSKAFLTELKRAITGSWGRFLAIAGIVALGCGFFAGLNMCGPQMRIAADRFYDGTCLYDVRLVSTMGFGRDQIDLIAQTEGVDQVMPSYSTDVMATLGDKQYVMRVESLHEAASDATFSEDGSVVESDSPDYLNRCTLMQGTWPHASNECVLSADRIMGSPINLGDTVEVLYGTESLDGVLEVRTFTVVGLARSSEYVCSTMLGSTTLGSGNIEQFMFVLPSAFDDDLPYTQVYLTVSGAAEEFSESDAYWELVERVEDRLEAGAPTLAQARLDEVRADAQAELDDAQAEYDEQSEEAHSELADAQAELDDARGQLDDAKAELDDALAQLAGARDELAGALSDIRDGEEQIASGEAALASGREELAEAEAALQDQFSSARAQLDEMTATLDDAQSQLDGQAAQLDESQAQLDAASAAQSQAFGQASSALGAAATLASSPEAATQAQADECAAALGAAASALDTLASSTGSADLSQLAGGISQLAGGISQLPATAEAGEEAYAGAAAQLAGLAQQLSGGVSAAQSASGEQIAASRAQIDDGRAQIAAAQAQVDDGRAQVAAGAAELDAQQQAAEQQIAESRAQLDAAEEELDAARRRLDEGRQEYESGLAQYEEGVAAYEEGRQEYESGLAQYEEGVREFQDAQAEVDSRLSDAASQLAEAQRDIDALEAPDIYVLDREQNLGAHNYQSDSKRIDNIGKVFPLFFYLVAALVALTTMTRMVEDERGEIGTHKALGYSSATIASRYIVYGAVASVIGAIVGMLFFSQVLPLIVMAAYGIMYCAPNPPLPLSLNPGLAVGSAAAGVGVTLLTTLAAAWATLRETPANLMLPRAPKAGKRILLERIRPIWSRTSFLWKVTFRNLFRYKKRLAMTVVGIAGCTALLLCGFGLRDSIQDIINKQIYEIVHYDVIVGMKDDSTDEDAAAVEAYLTDHAGATSFARSHNENAKVGSETHDPISALLVAPEDAEAFSQFVTMRTRIGHDPQAFGDDSVLVTEKLAKMLGIEVGDPLRIFEIDAIGNATGPGTELVVTGIVENYIYNYVYVGKGAYERAFGETGGYSSIYSSISHDPAIRDQVTSDLHETGTVEAVTYNDETIDGYRKSLRSVDLVVIVLVICAAALAFIVLYNLTNINIVERTREIASLKVLGFTRSEVLKYVFRETILLTCIGAGAGLVAGIFMEQFVVLTAEVDVVMFGREIHPPSFVFAFLVTVVFSGVVMLALRKKLNDIDMVESLKSVD